MITCPDRIDIGSDPYTCGGTWQVPPPDAYDACSEIAGWSITAAAGTVVNFGGVYTITGLPEGCTEITYTVYDGCGNESYCTTEVCVVDDIPPVPVCDFNTIVSLGIDGRAKIYAETFDDGSYDNCCLERIEVRRIEFNSCWNTFYGPYVEFCCDDIGPDPIRVELRAVDCAGNTNSCWVNVIVEDKLNPVIVCPPDITVSCDYKFDLNNLEATFGRVINEDTWDTGCDGIPGTNDPGEGDGLPQQCELDYHRNEIYTADVEYREECLDQRPYANYGPIYWGLDGYTYDNCETDVTEISNANLVCGVGVITRIFTATDGNGRTASCIQRITIVDCDPFYIADTDSPCRDRGGFYTPTDDVEWPCDVTLDGCSGNQTDPDYTGRPDYEDDKCSLVADTFIDEVFTIVPDACFKILRHWSIIDWCQTDINGLPYRWDYTQVIKVIDEEGPIITPADPGCDSTATDCYGDVSLKPDVEDCTPDDMLVYWWRIDAFNDGQGPIPGGYDFEGFTMDPSGNFPYGTHRILWVIEDMCGNKSTVEYTFEPVDCKKPSPVCINGLSSVVMPSSGQITVWAVDFDASSFDNCTEAEDLEFRIWYPYMDSTHYPDQSRDWQLPTATTSGDDVLFYLPTGAVFYCEALGNGQSRTFTVRIYVVDEAGNWDYCTTNITIDDNDDVCPDDPASALRIAGDFTTEYGETVDGVMTELTGGPLGMTIRNQEVDDNGYYNYYVEGGYDWNVTGDKEDAYLNGVTANDLSLIQRHVAGIEYLNSNYKLVAADANADTDIDIRDVLDLRKLLLGINEELPSNKSWRNLDADYTFPGVTNTSLPADVYNAEMISHENMQFSDVEADFIGVKVGDVDGDAIPNAFVAGEERGSQTLHFTTQDQAFTAGEVVEVAITSENFHQIRAYQMTLGFDINSLEYVGAKAGKLEVDKGNFGSQFADRGMVSTVWYTTSGQTANTDEVLFTVVFEAKQSGRLSQVLNIGSAITEAMAFNTDGKASVALRYVTDRGEKVGDAFALFQNSPNPFTTETRIGYILPQDADVVLHLFNGDGKFLGRVEQEGKRGYNEMTVSRKVFSAEVERMVYYQLETEGYLATKKMVMVK